MSDSPADVLHLHAHDEVVLAVVDLPAGHPLPDGGRTREPVPRGHKVATTGVADGAPVHKYGQVIGRAARRIEAGEHVHTHNLAYRPVGAEYEFGSGALLPEPVPDAERATFEGYVRSDGRVGTRNYIGVLSSVNCSATAVRRIAEEARLSGMLRDFPHVDGVVPLTHGTGCGIGDDTGLEMLRKVMRGYLGHPNFYGFLVIGLGCEHNEIAGIVGDSDTRSAMPLVKATIQDLGGTTRTVREGLARIREILPDADRERRTTVPVSELVLGTNCGGSDAYSGITANPALGAAVDLLVRHGGTGVLAETPEVYGAEHLLTRRAVDREVGQKLLDRIAWWEEYLAAHGGTMDNNPSPGNKDGGLTTILEKSLGAVAKGGTTALRDVVGYAEPITSKGFVFMDTPGYDPVSVTGLVAGGANLVCFTTGRGSAFGCKPVPSIKLATTSELYRRMEEDMDVDAGVVLDGSTTIERLGEQIFDLALQTASGRQTKSEELGYGDEEFVPWQVGAVI